MRQQNVSAILKGWLHYRRGTILSFSLMMILFLLMYYLYSLPHGPESYIVLLFGSIALVIAVFDFTHFMHKLAVIDKLFSQQPPLALHKSDNLIEQRYIMLLEKLQREWLDAAGQAEREASEAVQYYTLWSHQIKTPLAATRLLLEEDVPDIGALSQALYRIEQYVEMALQYQRLAGTSRDLVLRELNLDSLVRQAVRRTAALFIHKHLTLNLNPISCTVLSDEKWLVFILEQLLTNAVKYTQKGSITITLQTGEDPALVISDTGIGIRPEDLPRVFDWGYTGYNGRIEQRSTGIGLFLCKQAVSMLGHRLTLESTLGVGTQAILHLERKQLELE